MEGGVGGCLDEFSKGYKVTICTSEVASPHKKVEWERQSTERWAP